MSMANEIPVVILLMRKTILGVNVLKHILEVLFEKV